MSNSIRPERDRYPGRDKHHAVVPRHVLTRHDDTMTVTWLIGLATAIVAGGYLFLAESTRDDLKAININATRPIHTINRDATPVAAYSPLAEPPAELRK